MGIEALGIGAGLGAVGGAVAGARGTPDQVSTTNSSGTSQTVLNPINAQQSQLQQNSLDQYLQQMALANQYQQNMGQAQNYQDAAQSQAMNVLNGNAFNISPQQQALITQQRNQSVGQSTADINQLLNERLGALSQQAGQQGLRGQAYSQLQGDTMRTAAQQYGNTVRQADQQATGQALSMPYQTIAAQSPFIQGGMGFANAMNLQAQQNRVAAQNPYLLNLLQNERLATGMTNTTGNNQTVGKGQQGSFLGALQGFMSGGAGGLNAGAQAANAFKQPSSPAIT